MICNEGGPGAAGAGPARRRRGLFEPVAEFSSKSELEGEHIVSNLRLLLLLPLVAGAELHAETNDDRTAIRAAALDYIEGWYRGDAARMERALHPELAKRIVRTDVSGQSMLGHQDATTLVGNTRAGGGSQTPEARRLKEVTILDIYENAASVRIDASDWIDFLHLARWNGEWKIVNVLWELKPRDQ